MKKILGIISCNYQLDNLREMTQNRPIAATPFGGRYIMSDFVLSSMVNSGIKTVGFIAPYMYRPILEHLGSGKEWDLDRKVGGLFMLPGTTNWIYSHNRFSLKDLHKNIDFLQRENADYIILSGSNSIFNGDFRSIVESHKQSNADITMVYKELIPASDEDDHTIIIETADNGRISKMNKIENKNSSSQKIFTDIIIIGRDKLLDIVRDYEAIEDKDLTQVIRENLDDLMVIGYPYKGYFGRIHSKQSYYKQNMNLMRPEVSDELFMGEDKIITRSKDNPPTKYGQNAEVKESFISSGCLLDGDISRSIICRGVCIEEGAKVKNSIIMHECHISKNTVLENVILDKSVKVTAGAVLKGDENNPVYIQKTRTI